MLSLANSTCPSSCYHLTLKVTPATRILLLFKFCSVPPITAAKLEIETGMRRLQKQLKVSDNGRPHASLSLSKLMHPEPENNREDSRPLRQLSSAINSNYSFNRRIEQVCRRMSRLPNEPALTPADEHPSRNASTEQRPFRCETCLKYFSTPFNLKRHEKNVHQTLRSYLCPLVGCRILFSHWDNLVDHLADNHEDIYFQFQNLVSTPAKI
ncbi:uncharacterized protein BDR25DRAFT_362248 [Lindgomyces ingoldianus]|uniref:Uncharacterized protein n=1 Tax=Lindgomyces ingoldianus TaxID=673940 RepID=A0ACB6QCS4_9PLEO|nr:uncharacterized protein BDR25DRAFT_362248 [Lindgomyces ingoldianus]KAF2463940.1 hypothetical protein BDR25DRAFT_362248 [Lindgomyces ingoldianus]